MKFIKNHGGREKYYPTNLKKDLTGDCVLRAVSIATEIDYLEVRDSLFDIAKELGRMPNSQIVYETYLESLGWVKNKPLRKSNNKKYRLQNITKDMIPSRAIFHTSNHIAAVIDGELHDTWNCGPWCANSYYTRGEIK